MGRLDIALLGPPLVRADGRLIAFPTRKAAALLFYLAASGELHPREQLAALLWPDSDEERARGTLRTTLAMLRRALGDEGAALFVAERDRIGLAPGAAIDTDLRAIEAAYALARREGAAVTPSAVAQLRAAAGRYRGDFLTGFSLSDAPEFDDWAAQQREVWHRRADLVFDRLSQDLFEGGEFVEAGEVTARWVAVDPLNEAAHRRLMRVYFATGDRAGALRAYEACRAALLSELQAMPAPETAALAARIRAEPPPAEASRADDRPPIPLITTDAPLTGRREEHAALAATFRAARQGTGQVVSIEGEAGIGKSRLASEFLRWATAQGADTITGRALETGTGLPYGPLLEALRERLAREPDPGKLLGEVWLAELSRLLPELRDRLPRLPVPPSLGEAESRGRLFEALARVALALAGRAPLVWLVDDLHWADGATLDALRYLARRWAGTETPILLLLGVRAEELAASPDLLGWLTELGRDLPLRRIALDTLTAGEVTQLVGTLGVVPVAPATGGETMEAGGFGRWLFAETGGHPLFIAETMKALFERGGFDREGAGFTLPPDPAALRGYIAPGVQAVIRARLARLGQVARALIAAGAILGDGCAFGPLGRVADLGEEEALAALDELLARRLLREAERRYRFGHDKIREVVYDDAGEARRRIYHRRALGALEGTTAPAAELARHALAAELTDRALRYCVAAGDDALRLFATRDAIGHYERARGLLPEVAGGGETDAVAHLHEQLGWAYELDARYPEARAAYEAMLATARAATQPVLECAALNRLANLVGLTTMDLDLQGRLLDEARAAAEASGDARSLVETEHNLVQNHFFRNADEEMRVHGRRGVALAREHGLAVPLARLLDWLALAEVICGNWTEARDYAEEARALNAARGDRVAEGGNLTELAGALVRLGETRAAVAAARTAYTIAGEINHEMARASAGKELALGLLDCGDWAGALDVAQTSLAAARLAGYGPMLIMVMAIAGRVQRVIGATEAATALHNEAWAIQGMIGSPTLAHLIATELCADHAGTGDWGAAAEWLRRALGLRDYRTLYLGLDHQLETEALLRAGDAETALANLERFRAKIGENRRYRLPYLRARAVAAAWTGETGDAIARLEEAAALATTLDIPGERWEILAALGAAWRAQGEARRAQQAYTEAAAIVGALADGLPTPETRDRFLASPGVRVVIAEHHEDS